MKKELGIAILLVVLCVTTAILQPSFLMDPANVFNMLKRISMFGIFGIGLGMVIITGGIDLSVGAVFALQGVLLCMMLNEGRWPWPVAIAASIAGVMVLGVFHGFLVTKMKLQSFIVTLCGLLIYRGLARSITHDRTEGLGPYEYGWLYKIAAGKVHLFGRYDIPSAFFVLLGVMVVMWVVLHWSIYGRYLYAVGRNEEAARYSGIRTKLVIGSAYVLSLLLAGISGVIFVFDVRSISPANFGISYELYGIAAAVLGGCSLQGGEGSILGIVLGTALMQVLLNMVQLLGIPSTWELTVMGSVILLGVMFDQFLKTRKKKAVVVEKAAVVAVGGGV